MVMVMGAQDPPRSISSYFLIINKKSLAGLKNLIFPGPVIILRRLSMGIELGKRIVDNNESNSCALMRKTHEKKGEN
jgi:hypothetical protein